MALTLLAAMASSAAATGLSAAKPNLLFVLTVRFICCSLYIAVLHPTTQQLQRGIVPVVRCSGGPDALAVNFAANARTTKMHCSMAMTQPLG